MRLKGRVFIIRSLPFFVLNVSRFVVLPLLCVYIFGLANCVAYDDENDEAHDARTVEGGSQQKLLGDEKKKHQHVLLPLPIYALSIDTTENETDDDAATTCTRKKRKRAAVPVTLITKVCLEVVGVYSLVLQRGAPPNAVVEFCLGSSNDRSLSTRKDLEGGRGSGALSETSSVHVQSTLWSWVSSKASFLSEQVVGLTFANSIPVFVSDVSCAAIIEERTPGYQSQGTLSRVDGAISTRVHGEGEGEEEEKLKEVLPSKNNVRNGATDGYLNDADYTSVDRFYKTTIRTPAALLKLAARESSFVALHAYISSVQTISKAEVRSFLSAYTTTRPVAFWQRVLASLKVNARRVLADFLECFPPFSFSSSPLSPSSCLSASPSLLPALASVYWLVLLPSVGVGLTALVRPSSLLLLIIFFFCSPTFSDESWSASSGTRTLALYERDLVLRGADSCCERVDSIGIGGRDGQGRGKGPLKGDGTARYPRRTVGIGAVALAVVSCVLVPLFDIIHACLVRGRQSLSLSFLACVLGRAIVSVASQTVAAMIAIVFASLALIIVVSTAAVLEGQ